MDKKKITITQTDAKEQPWNNPMSSTFISIAFFVWIIGLTVCYCVYAPWHSFFNWRPDTKHLITEALKFQWISVFLPRLSYVTSALILNFIAILTGNRILRWLKVDFDSNLDKLIFSIPLGWSIYSIGIFYLGVSGLLYKEAVYCFLTLLGVLSILEIKIFFSPPHPSPLPHGERIGGGGFKIDKSDIIFLTVIITFVAVQFVTSFSPVVSADPLIYHMLLPKLHIEHHALVHIPGFLFSTLPAHTEMLYLLGLMTSGDTLSKLFSFSISLLFLISVFSIGTKYFSKRVGYLAVVIMITIQFAFPFSSCFSEPWIDVALGLFSLLAVYAFFIWIEERRDGYLYLSIICCALAGATKIQGLFFVLLFFLGFLLTVKKGEHFIKKLGWCVLTVCIIALPWYMRSWLLTGDPFFPFLYKYFGASASGGWSECSNECLQEFIAQSHWDGVKSFSDFIRINKDQLFSTFSLSPIIGIFLLPSLMTLRNGHMLIRYFFLITVAYYIFLLFTSPQMRFFYAGFAIMSIIIAYFIEMAWKRQLLTRIPVFLCIIVLAVPSFFVSVKWVIGPFFAGLGVLGEKQFLNEHKHGRVATWINENLPQNSKVLLWRLDVSYHLDRKYMVVNPAFQSVLDFGIINDTQTFLRSIKELGITHLLYDDDYDVVFTRKVKEFLDKCIFELRESGKITPVKRIDNCVIYSLAR